MATIEIDLKRELGDSYSRKFRETQWEENKNIGKEIYEKQEMDNKKISEASPIIISQ